MADGSPFDAVTAAYDATFGTAPSARLFRFRLAERVLSGSPPPARVLDIGCGTGDDTLWLAGQGYKVHGIDSSSAMVKVAREKARASAVPVSFECRPLAHLAGDEAQYDVVISNFGALNCVPLPVWSARAPALLREGGHGFVVLMGRRPLPEWIRRGFQPGDRAGCAEARVGSTTLPVYYPDVSEVKRALDKVATLTRVEAMGCLVPGPRYDRFGQRHPIALSVMAMGECVVRSLPVFRSLGDHTLFEFRRP